MGESYLKILKNIIFIIYWIEDEVKYVILTGSNTIVNWEIAMGKRRKSLFLTLIFRPRERFFAGQQLYLLEHELP